MRRYDSGRSKEERLAVKAIDKTCMRDHLELWKESFLKPLYEQIREDFNEEDRARQEQLALGSGNAAVM